MGKRILLDEFHNFFDGAEQPNYGHNQRRRKIPNPEIFLGHLYIPIDRMRRVLGEVISRPDVVVNPTICTKPRGIIRQNRQKKSPSRKLAVGVKFKPKRLKFFDFNSGDASQNYNDSRSNHYVATVYSGSILKWMVTHSDSLANYIQPVH